MVETFFDHFTIPIYVLEPEQNYLDTNLFLNKWQHLNILIWFKHNCIFNASLQRLGELGVLLYEPESTSKVETLDFEFEHGDDLGPWSFKDLLIVVVEEEEETNTTANGMFVTPPTTDGKPHNDSLSIR